MKNFFLLIPLLIAVAFFTLIERKVLAAMQGRRGPNLVGVIGLLQPFADGLKLFLKEIILPIKSNKQLFLFAPILILLISLFSWVVIPIGEYIVIGDINLGIMYLLATSSIGVYGIIISGWASNSKFAFLGALRSCAQMISYEVSLSIIIITVVLLAEDLNINAIIKSQEIAWNIFPLFPFAILFFVSGLAETNRPPFDLPEAEAELVAGYFVEYSSMGFANYFIAEYANIIIMSGMTVILFFGGWLPIFQFLPKIAPGFWFALKTMIFLFLFVWIRAAFPRYRFDQLMYLSWRIILPISLFGILLVIGIMNGIKYL